MVIGCVYVVFNNKLILQYGIVSQTKQITLPISYSKYYSLGVSGSKDSTTGTVATLNDVCYYSVTIQKKVLTSFTCHGNGYFITCGY